jgi:predicted TIM-barrel fold metal-dependent hydrolase
MNIELKQPLRTAKSRLAIVDCDVHPRASLEDLRPYLSNHWWHYLQTYGLRSRHGHVKGYPFPKPTPLASRRDSWPPDGGPPASDLDFVREQHLDFYGIEHGILNPLAPSGQGDQNGELSAALAFAINEWQVADWVRREPRFKASVVVPYENAEASAAEIRRRAGQRDFAHVLLLSRTSEALGRRRYWPIYQAAVEAGLPVGIHVFGYSGWAMTGTGWPSFYLEEGVENATTTQTLIASMIMEGVFEQYRDLKVVLIETGFGWLPALGWRLDKHWERMRDEVPHLKRPPSEYLREHFWVSTQPMEETDKPEQLIDVMKWIGFDRLLFASDYPHWDFDDPFLSLPPSLSEAQRRAIYSDNARAVYRLG